MLDKDSRRQSLWLGLGLLLAGCLLAALLMGCDGPTPNPPCPGPTPDPDPIATPTVAVYVGIYDILGATGDQIAFLDQAKAVGATGVRLFVCFSWAGPQSGGSPFLQVGTWKHENGDTFPLYRLNAWDEDFWTRLNASLCAARDRGIVVWLVVEDYCSLKGDQHQKYFNPMYSSEEALGPSTPGGVWGEAMKPYHLLLIDRTIAAANAVSGLDYLIEPMNEYDIVDGTDQQVVSWHAWAVDEIRERGVPLARIVGTAGRQASAIAAQVGLYSPHGIGRPDQIVAQAGIESAKIIFSSDGYWGGSGGCDAKGRCGVGLDVANAYGLAVLSLGAYGAEIIPREVYAQNNDRADVDLFGVSKQVIKAIAWAK